MSKLKKAGPNTQVRAIKPGFYNGALRKVGSRPFVLKEGDTIVDWMEEVDAPAAKPARQVRAPRAEDPPAPAGDEQSEVGSAELA
jgi:hypothetical protein